MKLDRISCMCGLVPALLALECGRSIGRSAEALQAACVTSASQIPADGWVCGQDRTVECTAQTTPVQTIFVVEPAPPPGQTACTPTPAVSDPGPFTVGDHVIDVRSGSSMNAPLCESHLHVVDTTAPTTTPHATNLWPPNHKYHTITLNDCVTVHDACDPSPHVNFTFAESDEAVNALGSGNTDPDIIIACDSVQVRSERAGPQNGRVYTLGWRATDASGNSVAGTCSVSVVHDQSGDAAVAGPAAYHLDASAGCNAPPPGGNGSNNPPPSTSPPPSNTSPSNPPSGTGTGTGSNTNGL
jgi:hypothetical protein